MNKFYRYLLLLAVMCSCSEYLDIVPDNARTIDLVFNSRDGAESFLFTCYNSLPNDGDPRSTPGLAAGDEIWLYPKEENLRTFFGSTWAYDLDHGYQNSNSPIMDYWLGRNAGKNLYKAIRDCNIFLEKVDLALDLKDDEKSKWIAEVKCLKAYYHYYLLRMYGPVPIIKTNLPTYSDPELLRLEREPVSKVVEYIVELLDEAIADLPLVIENELEELGRFTKPIAYSIKAKTLILAASPIFNRAGIFDELKSSTGMPLVDNTDNVEKWKTAKKAVEKAISVCHEAGNSLYRFKDFRNITDSTRQKMDSRGSVTDPWNSELVWGLPFHTGHLQEICQARFEPKDDGNHSVKNLMAPTLRMAELFYSEHGVPINQDKEWDFANRFEIESAGPEDRYYIREGYQTVKLHFDREPRFYASIGFDGGIWYGHGKFDDNKAYHIDTKAKQPAGKKSSEKYSITGYLVKKLVNYENVIGKEKGYTSQFYPFPAIRLADLYLLHAETANESGDAPDVVFKYLDQVRERAGLLGVKDAWTKYSKNPVQPETLEGRREIIKQERMIELAFEGQRYWDLRRWLDVEKYITKPIRGWNITEESTGSFYKVNQIYKMSFNRRDYLWPIKISELLNNDMLIQNPLW